MSKLQHLIACVFQPDACRQLASTISAKHAGSKPALVVGSGGESDLDALY